MIGGANPMNSSKYLNIAQKIQVHLRPDGCIVLPKSDSEEETERFSRFSNDSQQMSFEKIDPTIQPKFLSEIYRDIFIALEKSCDVSTIIASLSSKYNTEEIKNSIYRLERMGYLKLKKKIDNEMSKIILTGSTNHFYPLHVAVELTTKCNLRCKHCYASSCKGKDISYSELFQALSSLKDRGLCGIELTGGEPLLHPHFQDIVKFCCENFEIVGVLSNGTLIDEQIAEFLSQFNNILISISIDSSSPQFHDNFRGVKGAWQKAVNAIKLLTSYNIPVRVAMVVTPENFRELESTALLAKELGALAFSFAPILPFGRGATIRWRFTPEEVVEYRKLERKVMEKYKEMIPRFPAEVIEALSLPNCGAGHKTVVISPTGIVRPCVIMPQDFMPLGNIFTDSLEKIFSSPIIYKLAKIRWPNKYDCGSCRYEKFCRYCIYRGIVMYRFGIQDWVACGDKCTWAKNVKIQEILQLSQR